MSVERRGTKALELWAKRATDGYKGVSVDNMTTSWRNGLAFCALIHHFKPEVIDFNSLKAENVLENNALAFRVAEQQLGIPALLDAEDMVDSPVPDRLSILTYVSQYYQSFASQGLFLPGGKIATVISVASENAKNTASKEGSAAVSSPARTVVVGSTPPSTSASAVVATPRIVASSTLTTTIASIGAPPKAKSISQPPATLQTKRETEFKTDKVSMGIRGRREECFVCEKPVYLAERVLVGCPVHIRHRKCFRCARCSTQLTLANYYETEKREFCCETCPDEEKPLISTGDSSFTTSATTNNTHKMRDSDTESSSDSDSDSSLHLSSASNSVSSFTRSNTSSRLSESFKNKESPNTKSRTTFLNKTLLVDERDSVDPAALANPLDVEPVPPDKMGENICSNSPHKDAEVLPLDNSGVNDEAKGVYASPIPGITVDPIKKAFEINPNNGSNDLLTNTLEDVNIKEPARDSVKDNTPFKMKPVEPSQLEDDDGAKPITNPSDEVPRLYPALYSFTDDQNNTVQDNSESGFTTAVSQNKDRGLAISLLESRLRMKKVEENAQMISKTPERTSTGERSSVFGVVLKKPDTVILDINKASEQPLLDTRNDAINPEKEQLVASYFSTQREKDNISPEKKQLVAAYFSPKLEIVSNSEGNENKSEEEVEVDANGDSKIDLDKLTVESIEEEDTKQESSNISDSDGIIITENDNATKSNSTVESLAKEDVNLDHIIDTENDDGMKIIITDTDKLDKDDDNTIDKICDTDISVELEGASTKKAIDSIPQAPVPPEHELEDTYPDTYNPFGEDQQVIIKVKHDLPDVVDVPDIIPEDRTSKETLPPPPPPKIDTPVSIDIEKAVNSSSVPEEVNKVSGTKKLIEVSLNPFDSDEAAEPLNTGAQIPKKSTNPFWSDDEEDDENVPPVKPVRLTVTQTPPTRQNQRMPQRPPPRPPPPSPKRDDPIPKKRLILVGTDISPPSPTPSSRSGSSDVVFRLKRKQRPAPAPPSLANSNSGSKDSVLSSKNEKEMKNRSNKLIVEANVSDTPSGPSHAGERIAPKSEAGEWQRKKGPAPPRPVPRKRTIQKLPILKVQQELYDIEIKQTELERQGVLLETAIREKSEQPKNIGGEDSNNSSLVSAEDGEKMCQSLTSNSSQSSIEVEDMIIQLFELVNEKNELFRRQTELMYIKREKKLEEEHAELEYQIRCLMLKPREESAPEDAKLEEELLARLCQVVDQRDDVINCLERERRREVVEDECIASHLIQYQEKYEGVENSEDSELKKKKKKKILRLLKKKKKKKRDKEKQTEIDADKDVDETEVNKPDKGKTKKWFKKSEIRPS